MGGVQKPTGVQLSLGILDIPSRPVARARRPPPLHLNEKSGHALIEGFVRRLEMVGASAKTREAYIFQLTQLVAAGRRHGLRERHGLITLFRDERLLGLALTDDESAGGGMLSRWTLAQRRTAVRSFARLMAPELRSLLAEEPEAVVVRALRRVAERVGGGYRLTGGTPRHRGGRAPTPAEVDAIVEEVGKAPGFKGARNRAFFTLLYETGSRVNALRGLSGDAIIVVPGGRMRLMLHAKGQAASREVELGDQAAALLLDYVDAFNLQAMIAGRTERICFGDPGPVWRSWWGIQWAYRGVVEAFEQARLVAGTHAYTLHALRRGFATEAASTLPRHVVVRACGWQGLERLDNHYIRPRVESIVDKLAGRPGQDHLPMEARDAAAPV